jgi:hypothetical protein
LNNQAGKLFKLNHLNDTNPELTSLRNTLHAQACIAMPTMHRLFNHDAAKETTLLDDTRRVKPMQVRSTLKLNHNQTNQLLFVHKGKLEVVTFPILTTNEGIEHTVIGTMGDEADNLAPIAINGDIVNQSILAIVNQSILALVPRDLATQFNLPILEANPVGLDTPPPTLAGEGADRLHCIFNNPNYCSLARRLRRACRHEATHGLRICFWPDHQHRLCKCRRLPLGKRCEAHPFAFEEGSIRNFPGIFNPAHLDLAPFSDQDFAQTISVLAMLVLHHQEQHCRSVTGVARKSIQVRQ